MRVSAFRLLIALATLLVVSALSAAVAYASPPTTATGTTALTSFTFNVEKVSGGNTFIRVKGTLVVSGDWVGTDVFEQVTHIRADGSRTVRGRQTFIGSVHGSAPGTVDQRYSGTAPAFEVLTGTYSILSGTATGGLVGIHAQGTFTAAGLTGIYSGQSHFDP